MKNILISTNAQKALAWLSDNPGREYLAGEIKKATGLSKSGTNFALRDLVKSGALKREKRGKLYLYTLDHRHPAVKQIKVLITVVALMPLLLKLSSGVEKIILYGSAARGENTKDSDIDLFVVTHAPEAARKIVDGLKPGKKIQLIARTPLKYVEMAKTDPVFYHEVERGIVLREAQK